MQITDLNVMGIYRMGPLVTECGYVCKPTIFTTRTSVITALLVLLLIFIFLFVTFLRDVCVDFITGC
jgi:hypothetical protein